MMVLVDFYSTGNLTCFSIFIELILPTFSSWLKWKAATPAGTARAEDPGLSAAKFFFATSFAQEQGKRLRPCPRKASAWNGNQRVAGLLYPIYL